MKKLLLEINLDEQSIECLKMMKGRKLSKIGYVYRLDRSEATALIFDEFTVGVNNEALWFEEEEFSKLEFRQIQIINDVAYTSKDKTVVERYQYKDYDMTIDKIEVVCDHVSWEEGTDFAIEHNIKNVIILSSSDRQLVIYAGRDLLHTVQIYEDINALNEEYCIAKRWPLVDENDELADDVIYKRTIEKL